MKQPSTLKQSSQPEGYTMRRVAACLVCLLVFFGGTGPVLARTLVVLGDSLSAGYGLADNEGWVSLLAKRLAETDPQWQVINEGINGDTTAGGLARLPAILDSHQPDILVLELGGNDGLRGLPLQAMKANLVAMIRQARAQGSRVILVGMALPPNYGPYAEAFRQQYALIAREEQVPLVPFLLAGIDPERHFQPDGIHPTAEAQPLLLENVWAILAPMLASYPVQDRP